MIPCRNHEVKRRVPKLTDSCRSEDREPASPRYVKHERSLAEMRNAFKKKKRLKIFPSNPEMQEQCITTNRINRISHDWDVCKREMDSASPSPKLLLHRRMASPLLMMNVRSPSSSPNKFSYNLTKVIEVARTVSQNLIDAPMEEQSTKKGQTVNGKFQPIARTLTTVKQQTKRRLQSRKSLTNLSKYRK